MSSRRRSPRPSVLALVLLSLAVLLPSGCAERPRPNVVLIVLDTLRADHLSAYGYAWPTSPHLDDLADRGALFLDCTAQASWTMPSMISLMTGLPIFTTLYRIPDDDAVLAERFEAAGYRTSAAVANALLSDEAGFARGFQDFEARQKLTPPWSADDVVDRALADLDREDGRPFLLWLHLLDAHSPYTPPAVPFTRTADELFAPSERQTLQALLQGIDDEATRTWLAFQEPELAREVDRYDGELVALDASLGRLFDALRERGLEGNTYVAVVADHGETLFRRRESPERIEVLRAWHEQRGERLGLTDLMKKEHDGTVYEELVRTPFVVAGPGIAPGQRLAPLVTNLDVGPTLLGLCGLPVPDGPGRDLSAALRGEQPLQPAPFATSFCDAATCLKLPDGTKLIQPSPRAAKRRGENTRLYALRSDPLETSPIPLDQRPDGAELLQRLRACQAADPFAALGGQDADEETLQALRELGYVR